MKGILEKWNSISLVNRILVGMIIGIILGTFAKEAQIIGLLGELFVGALKAVAPILVFFLVMGALAQHKDGQKSNMGTVIGLYLIATFSAGLVAVIASFIFQDTVNIGTAAAEDGAAPPGPRACPLGAARLFGTAALGAPGAQGAAAQGIFVPPDP